MIFDRPDENFMIKCVIRMRMVYKVRYVIQFLFTSSTINPVFVKGPILAQKCRFY